MPIANFDKVELLLPMTGDNNGTTFTDFSLRNRTVTRTGAVTSTAQSKFASYGSSGFFDGTDDYITAGGAGSFNFLHDQNGNGYIGAWIYPTGSQIRTILSTGGETTANVGTYFSVHTERRLRYWVAYNGAPNYAIQLESANDLVPVNAWSFVEMRKSGLLIKLYLNGTEIASGTMSNYSNANATAIGNIGRTAAASAYFHGHINDLIVASQHVFSAPPLRMTQRTLTRTNTGVDSHEYDRAVLFDWNASAYPIKQVIPDESGNFEATDLIDLEYGVAFIRDGCSPVCRGPVEVDAD